MPKHRQSGKQSRRGSRSKRRSKTFRGRSTNRAAEPSHGRYGSLGPVYGNMVATAIQGALERKKSKAAEREQKREVARREKDAAIKAAAARKIILDWFEKVSNERDCANSRLLYIFRKEFDEIDSIMYPRLTKAREAHYKLVIKLKEIWKTLRDTEAYKWANDKNKNNARGSHAHAFLERSRNLLDDDYVHLRNVARDLYTELRDGEEFGEIFKSPPTLPIIKLGSSGPCR